MISLEMARKLRDAGMEWEPKEGDWYSDGIGLMALTTGLTIETLTMPQDDNKTLLLFGKCFIWFPRLDQLLAEVGKRGWRWWLDQLINGGYRCLLIEDKRTGLPEKRVEGSTPEDAAASALLWILDRR